MKPAYFERSCSGRQGVLCFGLPGLFGTTGTNACTQEQCLAHSGLQARYSWQERTPEPGKLAPNGLPCEDRREHAPPALLDAACRDIRLAPSACTNLAALHSL